MSGAQQRKGRRAEFELAEILSGYGYDVKPGNSAYGLGYEHIDSSFEHNKA